MASLRQMRKSDAPVIDTSDWREYTIPFGAKGTLLPYLDNGVKDSKEIKPHVRQGTKGQYYVVGIKAENTYEAAKRAWILIKEYFPGKELKAEWLREC
jgi:hypothetical protein